MLEKSAVQELLAPFDISLSNEATENLLTYVELLLRWNRKINLTSITSPEECVTRHFGESLLVSRIVPLKGRLLDIGSGAGFPGLAVKLIAPELEVVLLEPVAKKRAFLKEAARACGMRSVGVLEDRLEAFSRRKDREQFDIITVRAVGDLESVVGSAGKLLSHGGSLCLWVGSRQAEQIKQANPSLEWQKPVMIPFSQQREILVGKLAGTDDS